MTTHPIALFKTIEGVSTDQARDNLAAIGAAYATLDGYEGRHLYHDPESGYWLDVLRWSDRAKAAAMGPQLEQFDSAGTAMQMMDPASWVFANFDLVDGGSHGEPAEDAVVFIALSKSKPGVSFERAREVSISGRDDFAGLAGYVARHVNFDPDTGYWLDVTWWRDRKAAADMFAAFPTLVCAPAMGEITDREALVMVTLDPVALATPA